MGRDREAGAAPPRAWLRWLLPLPFAVAGMVLVLAAGGVVEIVGAGLLAIALTLAISLAFLEVGYSEDRARSRGEHGPGSGAPPPYSSLLDRAPASRGSRRPRALPRRRGEDHPARDTH